MTEQHTPFIITFAGVPGSSKSIVAQHLSITFSLPIFSTDTVRSEVKEDLQVANITLPAADKEYQQRHQERWEELLTSGKSFILDASVDRRWKDVKQQVEDAGYDWCIIDMELSEEYLTQLYRNTERFKAIEQLSSYLEQHRAFMKTYSHDVTLQIKDDGFSRRRQLAEDAVRQFLAKKQ